MKHILSSENLPLLHGYLGRNTLMAFDYDGTLAPIVADPAAAHMRPKTKEALRQLSRHHPIAVITGRARLHVLPFLRGVPILEVIGNHGFETYGTTPHQAIRQIAQWHEQLSQALSTLPCARIENKRFSLAIHYRGCDDPQTAGDRIRDCAAQLKDARLVGGKFVLNVVPTESPDKGVALTRLCERLGYSRAVFVGDDETDEDVFALDRRHDILAIRVGASEDSSARYYLNNQEEMDPFLELLLRH